MKTETRLNDTDRRAFIADCELANCTHSLAEHITAMSASNARLIDSPVEDPAAAVVGGSLLAFAQGVSRQNKEDVMDSFLFATLVANKAFNPQTQSREWYGRFNKVLAALGWISANWSYARYRATQQRFTMDQVGLEILQSIIAAAALPGPASIAMLKVAGDAVKAIQAQEKPLKLFESQTKMHTGANFRVGACLQSEDGTVNVSMGAVNFLAQSNVTNVLFWEWSSSNVEIYRGEDNMVLNASVYAGVRDLIKTRLGDNAKSAIEEFDI